MKTKPILIPVRSRLLDPLNKEQVRNLIEAADAKFRLSARAWEDGNNSGNAETLNTMNKQSSRLGSEGAALLAPLGITCTWPGLYPVFEVKGFTECSTKAAVVAALGQPRNWLKT